MRLVALLVPFVLVGWGCSPPPDVEDAIVASPSLTGQPAKEMVGIWDLTSGGVSKMTLKSDGVCTIESEANTPGGKMKSNVSGQWTADDGQLNIRRKGTDNLEFTATYDYKLEGSTLKLKRSGTKSELTYRRSGKT